MGIFINVILIVIGFAILIFSADFLIKGGVNLALHLKISTIFVSMTVIAFGTSLPELFISLGSNLKEQSEFVVSNIVGSNISNILLVVGFGAVIKSLKFPSSTIFKEIPFSIIITILLAVFVNLHVGDNGSTIIYIIDRIEAVLFVVLFVLFVRDLWSNSKKDLKEEVRKQTIGINKCLMYIIGGSIGLYIGGELVIINCVKMGDYFGINHSFIGLTVIALGTSMPELITSIYAIFKQEEDLAIGNVIGSNIFNILWVLGLTGLIYPIEYQQSLNHDIVILILINIVLCAILYVSKRHVLNRYNGIIFICCYFCYAYFAYLRVH